jgi:murein DD-endopeptidase MepM/ murein hydrolase activator NlpD
LYLYAGEEVDRQTHLGFDLASIAQSPVEASNSGTVVHADYLGIYGNTVIIDHGLGLFSLYGHLSSMDVTRGQQVARGDMLGRTGQTGLAAGDHLHFSMIVGGAQVTPLEWWDPKWVQEHVLSKLGAGSGTEP